ncbi:MAG TPA: PepSY domain-containing protein [Methylophilaceae bacterium]
MTTKNSVIQREWPAYNTIWRWHFYAGIFCIPFILVLATTGAIYLFKPQLETFLDRPFEHVSINEPRASAEAQVLAATTAVPGSRLNAYQLPLTQQSAVQILVGRDKELYRVYVHPSTLKVLKLEREDSKFMSVIHRLHGTLLLGDRGSNLVELAASWTIVMIVSGLYLWWPRNANGLAGILYPRLGRNGRMFWRDLHGVTGFWISLFALFLLLSGMPWAKSWGGMLKEVRNIGVGKMVQQDWTTGRSSELAERRSANTPVADDGEHAEHMGHMHGKDSHSSHQQGLPSYAPIDRLIPTIQSLGLAPPVLITPPSMKVQNWAARSDAQNRPLRVNLVLDANTGNIVSRKNFSDRPLLDRIIGFGVAAHEGQLFGWINQVLGVFTALGLILLSVSAVILWWKRRPSGVLGAPIARNNERFAWGLISLIGILGTLLPFLGISLLVVIAVERWILPYFPGAQAYLGLNKTQVRVQGS